LNCSTELLTPRESSTVSIEKPVLFRVKIEPGLNTIFELNDDSDSEVEVLRSENKLQVALSPEVVRKETTLPINHSRNLG
jgi:hypothetical protein